MQETSNEYNKFDFNEVILDTLSLTLNENDMRPLWHMSKSNAEPPAPTLWRWAEKCLNIIRTAN